MAKVLDQRSVPDLLPVYGRNIDHFAFKKGWTSTRLASELGITAGTLRRIRLSRGRYLDLDLMLELMRVFSCSPNDLLLPQPDIDYSITTAFN